MFKKKPAEGEQNDPDVGDYGLFKIPAEALLKQSRIEVGQLKAYISELEDIRLRYRHKVVQCYAEINQLKSNPPISAEEARAIAKEIKREELYTVIVEQKKKAELNLKKARRDNQTLLTTVARLQALLEKHGIDPKER